MLENVNLNSIFIVMSQGQFSIPRVCVEAILCVLCPRVVMTVCVCVCVRFKGQLKFCLFSFLIR